MNLSDIGKMIGREPADLNGMKARHRELSKRPTDRTRQSRI